MTRSNPFADDVPGMVSVPTIAELHARGGSKLVEVLARNKDGKITTARLTDAGALAIVAAQQANVEAFKAHGALRAAEQAEARRSAHKAAQSWADDAFAE